MSKAYVVGVGPGSSKYLTEKAKDVITGADIIVGWETSLETAKDLIKGKKVYVQRTHNFYEVAKEAANETRRTGKTLAVLRTGDPCISSSTLRVLKTLSGLEVEIVSGISSTQLAAALAHVSIDRSVIISFHEYGDPEEKRKFLLNSLRNGRNIIMLVNQDFMPNNAAKFLIEEGIKKSTEIMVCENLTRDDESVFKGSLADLLTRQFSLLSVLVIINSDAKETG